MVCGSWSPSGQITLLAPSARPVDHGGDGDWLAGPDRAGNVAELGKGCLLTGSTKMSMMPPHVSPTVKAVSSLTP